MSALSFGTLPTTDEAAPTTAEIRAELHAHSGMWAVVYRADRMARAQTYADAVNNGTKFGPGVRAVVRKLGAECRVFASFRPSHVAGVPVTWTA